MATPTTKFRRDLFEIENARNLTRDDLVGTFVPTGTFWRLLSPKNHIVLGSRGSGKTTVAKMLSHDHLSRLSHDRAKNFIAARNLIGIYVPTRLEWVGGLKNKPWQTEEEAEGFFQWRMNVSTCLAFLITLRSCLDAYVVDVGARARIEADLVQLIAKSWSGGKFTCDTIRALQIFVDDVEHEKQQQLARLRAVGRLGDSEEPVGIGFGTDLFEPLKRAITLTSRALDLPEDCAWVLAIDEAEFLRTFHHRILNSYLRAYSGNLFFKITTMPYFHHTLETNAGVPLDAGHDFEYVYIDHDPILWKTEQRGEDGQIFANTLFKKRAETSGSRYWGVQLKHLLGSSELLDRKATVSPAESLNAELLRKYATPATIARAEKLMSKGGIYRDQVVRKIRPALLLRHAVESAKGRAELDIYSGETMVIRCSDANPRRLVRIFNSLLLESNLTKYDKSGRARVTMLPRKAQTRIMAAFSTSCLTRVQSEPKRGPQLFAFLSAIGSYMRGTLHEQSLTTDQISSVIISRDITDEQWALVRRSVGLGLLYPNVNAKNPDQLPEREGVFHLAYVLAPHFKLLPRKGKARSLENILRAVLKSKWGQDQLYQGTLEFGGLIGEPDDLQSA